VRPLVSILTPSYNQARWLKDNIDSVARQSYGTIEHIIVDGASTDGSVEILRASERPGLTWRSEPDTGQSAAINRAFAESRGDVVGWLNSDDAYFGSDVVEQAVALFERRPAVAVVYGHAVLADAAGGIFHTMWVPPYDYRLLRLHDYIVQPATFIRRSALDAQMVDESFDYMMDYELWLRLGMAHPFARLRSIVAIDRHHGDRKSFTRLDLAAADERRLIQMYGIHRRPAWWPLRKALKIAGRLAGTTLIREAVRQPRAYNGPIDRAGRIMIRQLTVPRSRMLQR
jgi:glycosyltransferase involved in cell wall biosynthesis